MNKKKQGVVIVLRLLALAKLIDPIVALPGVAIGFIGIQANDMSSKAALGSSFVIVIAHVLVSGLIWIYAGTIADAIGVGLDSGKDSEWNYDMQEIQVIAISVLGLYVLSSAVPAVFNMILTCIFPKLNPRYDYTLGPGGKYISNMPITDILSSIIRVGIGLIFLLQAKNIVRLVRDVWSRGKSL